MIVRKMNEPVFSLELTQHEARQLTKYLGRSIHHKTKEAGIDADVIGRMYVEMKQAMVDYGYMKGG
jgi:PP-loop superfamily ATP-utilizing enzyme